MAESMSRLHNPRRPMESSPMAKGAKPASEEKAEGHGDPMHAAAESMHKAEPHGKHMVMSHDGFSLKSHSVDEQGNHDGPHEDDDAKAHVQRFMGTDEGESHDDGMEPEETSGNLY